MSESTLTADLEDRLHDFEERLATATERFRSTGVLLPEDEREIELLRSRSNALRRKFGEMRDRGQSAPSSLFDAEWRSLGHALEDWAERIDREYRYN
jgi:uncharacterized coiled-coil protein SlyX